MMTCLKESLGTAVEEPKDTASQGADEIYGKIALLSRVVGAVDQL